MSWNRENGQWIGIYENDDKKLAGFVKLVIGEPLEEEAYPEELHYDEGFNKLLALEIKLIETAMNNSPKYFEDDLAMIK